MSEPLEFTGERFVPGTEGEIAYEHWHRYFFARRFVSGRRVLDVACGEGYGSALLSAMADSVVGVDIDAATVAHADAEYRACGNVRFVEGSVAALPLAPASVDAIVSFETLEHVDAEEQRRMIAEFDRVLAPNGILIVSSPNRVEYSDARNYVNPFHRHELDRDELSNWLGAKFPARHWYSQRRYFGSALWAERGDGRSFESLRWDSDGSRVNSTLDEVPAAMYYVVVAARNDAALPAAHLALSLFCDKHDREWRRVEEQQREVLRLDQLLKNKDAHIRHLEQLVDHRNRIIVERDAQLAAAAALQASTAAQHRADLARAQHDVDVLSKEQQRLERAVAAQERIIAYRQSARWWLKLPWLRIGLLWKRLSGG